MGLNAWKTHGDRSGLCGGWSAAVQCVDSAGHMGTGFVVQCVDTFCEHVRILSLDCDRKVLEGSTEVMCITDDVRILQCWMHHSPLMLRETVLFGQLLHQELWNLIVLHCSCLFWCFFSVTQLIVGNWCVIHSHMISIFASSDADMFCLNNPHV